MRYSSAAIVIVLAGACASPSQSHATGAAGVHFAVPKGTDAARHACQLLVRPESCLTIGNEIAVVLSVSNPCAQIRYLQEDFVDPDAGPVSAWTHEFRATWCNVESRDKSDCGGLGGMTLEGCTDGPCTMDRPFRTGDSIYKRITLAENRYDFPDGVYDVELAASWSAGPEARPESMIHSVCWKFVVRRASDGCALDKVRRLPCR